MYGPIMHSSWTLRPADHTADVYTSRSALVIVAPFCHEGVHSHLRELLVEDAVAVAAHNPLEELRGRHAGRTTGREEFAFMRRLPQSGIVLEEKRGGHIP